MVRRGIPEVQCALQWKLAIEREIVVGQCQRRTLDHASLGFEKPCRETKQARLAAAVRPRDLKRIAGTELEAEVFEQQPPAAAKGHLLEP